MKSKVEVRSRRFFSTAPCLWFPREIPKMDDARPLMGASIDHPDKSALSRAKNDDWLARKGIPAALVIPIRGPMVFAKSGGGDNIYHSERVALVEARAKAGYKAVVGDLY